MHKVVQGECLSSIADRHGFFWETLWDLPENAALKARRGNPNVLFTGDEVTIPERRPRDHLAQTAMRHRYRRRGVPARVRLRLLDFRREPRSGLPYELDVDGTRFTGKVDADGRIVHSIPPGARKGKLTLTTPEGSETYDLLLGQVDPVAEDAGVEQRLQNLGCDVQPGEGLASERAKRAIRTFQESHELEATGVADAATRERLAQEHGC